MSRLEDEYKDRIDFKMYDAAGLSDEIRRQYKYVAYPQIVILDAHGEIRFNRFGFQTYDSLKADLESVLSKR